MNRGIFLMLLAVLLSSGCVEIALGGGCDEKASREATVSTDGATGVRIIGRAGELEVAGSAGATVVDVAGTACASTVEALESVRLVAERRGSLVWIEADFGDRQFRRQQRQLDLVVTLPDSLPVEIDDRSGDVDVRNVAALRLDDRSGDVTIAGVAGALEVDDSSGELTIENVGGDVVVRDSSGDLRAREVGGTLRVRDSSGDIRVAGVERDVIVERDSSGDIEVADVEGDFVVEADGSGDVEHSNVAGRVDIAGKR